MVFFPDMLPSFKSSSHKLPFVNVDNLFGVNWSIWLRIAVKTTEVANCHLPPPIFDLQFPTKKSNGERKIFSTLGLGPVMYFIGNNNFQ
jgi:hypothetical protein